MHLLFIHQNFPAQFGHIAAYLSQHKGYRCTFADPSLRGMYSDWFRAVFAKYRDLVKESGSGHD